MSDKATPAPAIDGITICRASRLEALLEPLIELLDRAPPQDVLAAQTIVAAHPGMRQWLVRALARARGAAGIVANVDVVLPSTWQEALAREVLGESAVALRPYRRDTLRWHVHECLDEIEDKQISAYLQGSDRARRRFQLADRLAHLYSRYFVYRPDWLRAWAGGRSDLPEPTFLAPLWRSLRTRIGIAQRGELIAKCIARLAQGRPAYFAEEPLHVFGFSHLAPSELTLLRAVARYRPIVIYVPDPCIEYWAGLHTDLSHLRELVALDELPVDSDPLFIEQGHPLLASWGRVGQHLMLALEDAGDEVRRDVRHWRDEAALEAPRDRLASVQESVRRFDSALLRPGNPGSDAALNDRSLRVHVCHTRLRELEVLRDALLLERVQRPDLKPSDIVVMAPDIQAYVPLLASVFGEAGRHDGPLPYHLADVAVARSHRLFAAFETLLALPQSRLTAPEVIDLLQIPEIARAHDLDAVDVDVLQDWLRRSRVAWALDADFRAEFGVPAIAEHTFAWGMDRLLAGYVLGDGENGERRTYLFPDGQVVLPIEGVHGTEVEILGALDRLLRELDSLRTDMRDARTASAWSAWLEQLIASMFRVDNDEVDAREALRVLRQIVHSIEVQTHDAGLDPVIEFDVAREVLREQLASVSERQRFLIGGMTFCGMVPQRAIPFRVIAILGLNDGEFPRAPGDGGLDLMARHPRLGDRDVRNDDRYLFLETLMSARDMLHLSYIGESVRDGKPRNACTPLVDLMAELDAHADLGDEPEKADRPWRVHHPLQPFDPRYFDGTDPRLFSFRADLASLTRPQAQARPPFVDIHAEDSRAVRLLPHDAPIAVALAEVLSYYRDPARQLLRDKLHLRLDALDSESLSTSEPMDAHFERFDRVARRLVLDVVDRSASNAEATWQVPDEPPDWLRSDGLWPPGHAGANAWLAEKEKVQKVLDQMATHPMFQSDPPTAESIPIDCKVAGFRIEGELARVRHTHDTVWLFDVYPDKKDEAALTFRERIGLFLEWALLHLRDTHRVSVRVLLMTKSNAEHPWQDALNAWNARYVAAMQAEADSLRTDLQARVVGLLAFWARAQMQPSWYFPATSWEAADSGNAARIEAKWNGVHQFAGERDYAPGYSALLARDADFESGSVDHALLVRNARELHALITFADFAEEPA